MYHGRTQLLKRERFVMNGLELKLQKFNTKHQCSGSVGVGSFFS